MLNNAMIDLHNIQSLTDFQRSAKRQIRGLKRSGQPRVLTVNGRAEIVVQDAGSYQKLLDRLGEAEAVAAVREGLQSLRTGKGKPAVEVLDRIRRKHQIPFQG
jgi:hypothetical protein